MGFQFSPTNWISASSEGPKAHVRRVFSLNKETNTYTIGSDGTCRTVTIQIDGTQYPHRQYKQPIVDSVMVLDKKKPYKFNVSGCTSHPTKVEVVEQCSQQTKMCPPGNYPYDKTLSCFTEFAEAINSCVGGRLLEVVVSETANGGKSIRLVPHMY